MNYLIVDDEQIILEGMEWSLREVIGEGDPIYTASDPYKALEIVQKNEIDIVFCDVDMPGMNGLHLADEIRNIREDIDIIFATGYAHYSLDAWRTTARAFILKPVSEEDIKGALDRIMRNRIREEKKAKKAESVSAEKSEENTVVKKDIVAMCFGNFEISYNGKPVHFARKKSKEMLAYLVDRRGAMISTDEIRMILWEEEADTEEKKGYVRVLANDIRKGFESLSVDSILINNQNSYGVDISRISCDYFDFLAGDEKAKKAFQDEYMVQYSWAESTLARLLNMKNE